MALPTYPVHVRARLDPRLSRGLWLVKWLLVLPHYVVLAFLWLALVVLSVGAFFAILVTGRYPRPVFDFNVGVLRWTWRVNYYAYGALGTDRYPPFSLKDEPGYPAHLEVDYPQHLSRGLVLVKWWLLALPHYVVVGLLVGGGYAAGRAAGDDRWPLVWGGGLIGLLVLVAAIALLFTGRYPRALFDLVVGLNRWVLRVAAYAGLLTDEYPPFRLDQGGEDPDPPGLPATSHSPQPSRPSATRAEPWTAGRVSALVAGSVGFLFFLGLTAAGSFAAYADTAMRDDSGFVMSGGVHLATDSYALTSANLELHAADAVRALPRDALGDVKITVSGSDRAVFVGIAPTGTVQSSLAGVAQAQVVSTRGDHAAYRSTPGTAPRTSPENVLPWTAHSEGSPPQDLRWRVSPGDWTVVVMNADGSAGVDVVASVGATVPALRWLVAVLLVAGGAGLLVSLALIVAPAASAARAGRGSPHDPGVSGSPVVRASQGGHEPGRLPAAPTGRSRT